MMDRVAPARRLTRALASGVLVLGAVVVPFGSPTGAAGDLVVRFVDVGRGDAAIYVGPCGEAGVIDVMDGSAGVVAAELDALGVGALEWIAISHYDSDHVGDVQELAAMHAPERVYDRGGDRNAYNSDLYRQYFDWVTSVPGRRQSVDIGAVFSLCSGAVTFTVLSAGTDGTAADGVAVSTENDRSLCIKVEYAQLDVATCGDIGGTDEGSRTDVETAVADQIGDVEVVKVNHHGSAFSSNATYVNTLSPAVAVIPVGPNSTGLPDPNVVARWDAVGDVFRPDRDGDVTVRYGGGSGFTVTTAAGQRSYAVDEAAAGVPARDIADACPPSLIEEDGFADVPAGNVHEPAVDCVAWYEIAAGLRPGVYDPAGTVSRAQMATFVVRLLDVYLDVPSNPPDAFDDDDGDPHELNINRLAALGVVSGTGPRRFSPTATVTRGQMATFLVGSLEEYGVPLSGADRFADDDGHTHEGSINAVASEGIAAGSTATTFNPDGGVRRDHMASFVARTLDLLVEEHGRSADTSPPPRCASNPSLPATHADC